jgi:hypothetical protein
MILLRRDCLVFETSEGNVPLPAEEVTMEIIGDAIEILDEETIKQAAEAVLFYFKEELGQTTVSITEFTAQLERALNALGLTVQSAKSNPSPTAGAPRVVESNLLCYAPDAGPAMELTFFPSLRMAVHELLAQSPDVIRFRGLRPCVKQMLKARRWTHGCQGLNDQIVEYLRSCFDGARRGSRCALVVS